MEHGWEQRALDFIKSEQQADGSFATDISQAKLPFRANTTIRTTFTTALLLRSLHGVPGAQGITDVAAKYLLSQQTKQGTWNYWDSRARERKTMPLPDDLDDTACVVSALQLHGALKPDGAFQAQLARTLIAAETSPGGPYKTWTVSTKTRGWDDVDPAVNANVGYMLSLQQVSLQPLNDYISSALRDNALKSPYYVSSVPTLFFMSQWYTGTELAVLQRRVQRHLATQHRNPLLLSMLLLAAQSSGIPAARHRQAANRLIALRTGDHWPAAACYIHRTKHHTIEYGGSAALTTAFALKALATKSSAAPAKHVAKPRQNTNILRHATQAVQFAEEPLRSMYLRFTADTVDQDTKHLITDAAGNVVRAFNVSLSGSVQTQLNLGSLNGWIAYTIYDDLLDEEGSPEMLSAANFAMRQSLAHFHSALPNNQAFQDSVKKTFMTIDAANLWEMQHARVYIAGNTVTVNQLPDYGDLSQLANRSWGHTLAACGTLHATNLPQKTHKLELLRSFFRHYLIARQLNDDAHDWERDLQHGHLTAVVTALLRAYGNATVELTKDKAALQQLFWSDVIKDIARLIKHHTAAAMTSLAALACDHPETFHSWLTPLEQAADEALSRQEQATEFIARYLTPPN